VSLVDKRGGEHLLLCDWLIFKALKFVAGMDIYVYIQLYVIHEKGLDEQILLLK
jgi:hypothetical protein